MSSIALQLPTNYVEFDREEMEYIDGGSETKKYWWGYATNLSPSECADMADSFAHEANRYQTIAILFGAGAVANPVFIGGAAVILELSSLQCSQVATDLNTAARKRGATLNTNTIDGFVDVTIW